MSRKVLLVNFVRPYTLDRHATRSKYRMATPGLLYLKDALEQVGVESSVRFCFPDELESVVREATSGDWLCVGFSVMIDHNLRASIEATRRIKELAPALPIVWGGAFPSAVPRLCLEEAQADYVVISEGELTLQELVLALRDGGSMDEVQGLAFRRNGDVRINPRRPFIEDLDSFRMNVEEVPDDSFLFTQGSIQYIKYTSSRGCPFDCTFCHNSTFNQRRYRTYSADFVIEDFKRLKKRHDFNGVLFVDDYFFANKKRAFEILRRCRSMGLEVLGMFLRLEDVREEHLKGLLELGVTDLAVAPESASDRLLELMGKRVDQEKIMAAFETIGRHPEFQVISNFMIGVPTESPEEMYQTLQLAGGLKRIIPKIRLCISIYYPVPGTTMMDIMEREGLYRPRSLADWCEFRTDDLARVFKWLPWMDSKHYRALRASELLCYLANDPVSEKGHGAMVRWGREFFRNLALERIRSRFFLGYQADVACYRTLLYAGHRARKAVGKLFS